MNKHLNVLLLTPFVLVSIVIIEFVFVKNAYQSSNLVNTRLSEICQNHGGMNTHIEYSGIFTCKDDTIIGVIFDTKTTLVYE